MPAALVVVAVIALWEGGARLLAIDRLLLPLPSEVATALYEDRALLLEDLAVTAGEVALGLLLAVLGGAAVGIAMHLSRTARRTLKPLVVGSQAVPVPVIAPLLVVVLGFGLAPKVLLVAIVCFFPVTINLTDGLRAVDEDQRKLLRTLDAGRWQTFTLLEAPTALPSFFTGLRIAAAVAVIGAVFAEWAGADAGLGHLLLISGNQLETARQFAAVALLFALAVGLYGLFGALERRIVTWLPTSPSPKGP